MKAIITIDMDGAAFEANDGADEMYRIFRDLAERVSEYGPRRSFGAIRDLNGNKVGELRIEESREMEVLNVPSGFVFLGADDSILLAEFNAQKFSLTGPTWEVWELDKASKEDCCEAPALYHDYATEAGRKWRKWRAR